MTTVIFYEAPGQIRLEELETLDRESYVWVDGTATFKGATYPLIVSPGMRSALSTKNLDDPAGLRWSEDPSYSWRKKK